MDIPVTLKMRLGWDDSNRNAPNLARIAQECGIRMVTVHGRTRCQFYTGAADWKAIRRVKEVVSIPVIANGDMTTFEDVTRCLEDSGADGVMIGRGTYGRPWFIGQVIHYLRTGERLPDLGGSRINSPRFSNITRQCWNITVPTPVSRSPASMSPGTAGVARLGGVPCRSQPHLRSGRRARHDPVLLFPEIERMAA